MSIIATSKQYAALIADINKGTTARREQLDAALRYSAFHAAVHRNVSPALDLFRVVGRESNLVGMKRWLARNAPIAFKDGVAFFHEKMWKLNYRECSALEIEREINEALPFWRIKAEDEDIPDTIVVDYKEILERVRKEMDKAVERAEAKAKRLMKANPGKNITVQVEHGEALGAVVALANNMKYAD